MAWSYFSCGVSEKVQFMKDGVQTVILLVLIGMMPVFVCFALQFCYTYKNIL